MLPLFALTLFVSATLLFLVQPMVGKMLLPSLGGTPAVWNTCMVFFQAMLLLGYLYSHLTTTWLGPRRQAYLHLAILLLPALALPIAINRDQVPQTGDNPVLGTLSLLFLSAGLPFFVVATSAPLLQRWFASTSHPAAADPYFLYGASNLGSMLALLGYPFVVERYLVLKDQALWWTAGYALLAVLTGACALLLWKSPNNDGVAAVQKGSDRRVNQVPALTGLRWVILAFVPSSLMLGVTTYITTDIAAIPLLWVLPLALYLLSFILVFSRLPAFVHWLMVLLLPVVVLVLIFVTYTSAEWALSIEVRIALHLTTLFVVAMVCHGELARSRPDASGLTGFYLLMSLGGVLGGTFNALAAPVLFSNLVEYPLVLVFACLLLPRLGPPDRPVWAETLTVGLAVIMAYVGTMLLLQWHSSLLPTKPIWPQSVPAGIIPMLVVVCVAAAGYLLLGRGRLSDRGLDLLLPLLLAYLLIGSYWGLIETDLYTKHLPEKYRLWNGPTLTRDQLYYLAMLGVPCLCCLLLVRRPVPFGLGVGALFLVSSTSLMSRTGAIHQERSFFGVITVRRAIGDGTYITLGRNGGTYHMLVHGTTMHGVQRMTANPLVVAPIITPVFGCPPAHLGLSAATHTILLHDRQREPIGYFQANTPIGQVFRTFRGPKARKNVAVFGLGTGGLAGYIERGTKLTFFEIDNTMVRIASEPTLFTYLRDARERGVDMQIIMGDARLQLEKHQIKNPEDKYDLIIMDAFSSDAVPIHLVSREAIEMYFSKMTEDGIVIVHISNRYLDLQPVLARLKEELDLAGLVQSSWPDTSVDQFATTWVLLARNPHAFDELLRDRRWLEETLESSPTIDLWTDDFSNLWSVRRKEQAGD
jgi:hypothetical protein